MSDVWGSEAREAVAHCLVNLDGHAAGPHVHPGYLQRADAVLEALTPHAWPADVAFKEVGKQAGKYLALRAAVLAKAQEWDQEADDEAARDLCGRGPWSDELAGRAAELRALAGESA